MDKKIRAKMVCDLVNPLEDQEDISLRAVTEGSEENKEWSKYTPAGLILLTITNPDAKGAFVPGKEYYVDFTPAN